MEMGAENSSVRVLFLRSSLNTRMVNSGLTTIMMIDNHMYWGTTTSLVISGGFRNKCN